MNAINGATLAIGVYIGITLLWTFWPEIKARITAAREPATYATFDCRGGIHGACETCSCSCHVHAELAQWVEHDTAMGARAERLGYTR